MEAENVCRQTVHAILASWVNGETIVKNHVETVLTARANKTQAIAIDHSVTSDSGAINVTDNVIGLVLVGRAPLQVDLVIIVPMVNGMLDVTLIVL